MRINKNAQSIIEYSVIAVLVILGIVLMGPYLIRSINAHFHFWDTSIQDSANDTFERSTIGEFTVCENDGSDNCVCSCPDWPADPIPCLDSNGDVTTEQTTPDCNANYPNEHILCGESICPPTHRLEERDCDPGGCADAQGIPTQRCVSDDRCCHITHELGCGTVSKLEPVLPTDDNGKITNCYWGQRVNYMECGANVSGQDAGRFVYCEPDPSCEPTCIGTPPSNGQACPGTEENLPHPTLWQTIGGQCPGENPSIYGDKCVSLCDSSAAQLTAQEQQAITDNVEITRGNYVPGLVKHIGGATTNQTTTIVTTYIDAVNGLQNSTDAELDNPVIITGNPAETFDPFNFGIPRIPNSGLVCTQCGNGYCGDGDYDAQHIDPNSEYGDTLETRETCYHCATDCSPPNIGEAGVNTRPAGWTGYSVAPNRRNQEQLCKENGMDFIRLYRQQWTHPCRKKRFNKAVWSELESKWVGGGPCAGGSYYTTGNMKCRYNYCFTCGNGILEAGEQCDDGNTSDILDGCSATCSTSGSCGNGRPDGSVVETDEECDFGTLNGQVGTSGEFCKPGLCVILPECGNDRIEGKIIETGFGPGFTGGTRTVLKPGLTYGEAEACDPPTIDPGDSTGCTATCSLREDCGNGVLNLGEECDPNIPGTVNCSSECSTFKCGDGNIDEYELCDDGNNIDFDGCTDCFPDNLCGNGQQDSGLTCVTQEMIDAAPSGTFRDPSGTVDATLCQDCDINSETGVRSNCTDYDPPEFLKRIFDDEECDDHGVSGETGCNDSCQIEYFWHEVEDWSPCTQRCGTENQTQTVQCRTHWNPTTSGDQIVAETFCDAGSKPSTTRSCGHNTCDYSWAITGTDGVCAGTCGGNPGTENVTSTQCQESGTSVPNQECIDTIGAAPTTEPCTTEACPPPPSPTPTPAPGQSGSAPGQSGSTPGQSGNTPGQSGSTPPGQSGSTPGQSGSAPGQSQP